MRKIKQIIVHCSATPPKMDIGAAEIKKWHVDDNGWSDIGYHFIIRRDGTVELGRPVDVAGAHAYGFNDDTLGVCLIGGVDEKGENDANYTKRQLSKLLGLNATLEALYSTEEQTCGHRDLAGVDKGCPCFDVAEYLYG